MLDSKELIKWLEQSADDAISWNDRVCYHSVIREIKKMMKEENSSEKNI